MVSNGISIANLALLLCLASSAISSVSAASAPHPDYQLEKSIRLRPHFTMRSDWSASAYQAKRQDNDDIPSDVPAKLCFVRSSDTRTNCTKITSGLPNNPEFVYNYQTVKELRVVLLKPQTTAVYFHAEFYGGGSGFGEQFSLWTYDPKSDAFWPALVISTNELAQQKIFSNGPLAGYVVTADAEWQSGEGHFGAHQYEMTVYRLSGQSYLKVLGYLTQKRYGGEEAAAQSNAIDSEMRQIRVLLKTVRQ